MLGAPDLDLHRTIDPALDTVRQADSLVDHTFRRGIFGSETNVLAAIIDAMNIAVPKDYLRAINRAL